MTVKTDLVKLDNRVAGLKLEAYTSSTTVKIKLYMKVVFIVEF
jgi:hypothetical protein